MTVVPVAYEIPDDILAGLLSGEYMRFGSVVRDGTKIIMHLKEVAPPIKELGPEGGATLAIGAALKNPKVLIGLGTATVIAVGSVAIWAVAKSKKPAEPEVPASVVEYNEALAAYLGAIQEGTLTAAVLDRLIAALDAIKDDSVEGGIRVEFSVEQSAALVDLAVDFTKRLADANSVRLDDWQLSIVPESNPIIDLRQWLELQKRIVEPDDELGSSHSVA
ncbi:hypothetical protein [Microbacterium sp. bgisy203]|uniref:hypothetical protein n=1 Tax=Microbacterium sp. bgisy203 TaxID=3413799 RepID=UPI003D7241D7